LALAVQALIFSDERMGGIMRLGEFTAILTESNVAPRCLHHSLVSTRDFVIHSQCWR
jgi:hypothetical protein